MKTGSIRISKGGNRISLSGDFANDFFKAAQKSHEDKQHDHTCHCGYGQKEPHEIGKDGCCRFITATPTELGFDRWLVDGHEITGTSMREQRGYHKHPCGCWSRWPDSSNSIEA